MARIAGVNLPNQKRLEIGLTYIYGIGQSTAQQDLRGDSASRPTRRSSDLTDEEVTKLRDYIDAQPPGRGRPPPRAHAGDQAPAARSARTAACATAAACRSNGQRTKTNARTRKGPKKTVGRGKKAK